MFFMQPRVREADRLVRSKEYFGPQVVSIFIRWSKSIGRICITRMSYVNEKIQLRTCGWEHLFKKKKTEVIHQPKPRSPYIAPLREIQKFTYLGSIITNDRTSPKDVENGMSKARGAFCRLQKRVCENHSLRLLKFWYIGLLSSIPSCMALRHGYCGETNQTPRSVSPKLTLPPLHHEH